jgi:hypothetical protein
MIDPARRVTGPRMGPVARRGGSIALPSSAISAFEVVSAAILLDQTGDYGDATARTGFNGNGWVCKAQMPWLVGQTFDPTKIVLTVNDPGYDAAGNVVTRSRTVRGRIILNRQYNAETSPQSSNDGITFTVHFTLTDTLFSGSTIVAASAEAGFYGASAAGAIAAPANNSTRVYPKPLWTFYNAQQDRVTGASWRVEGMASSRWGQQGLMVPRVEFIAKDHLGNAAATQVATDTELSQIQKNGNIAECYPVVIPTTNLTQVTASDQFGTVNVKVYPWIGDADAVLDLEVDGFAWPTIRPLTPLRFVCDKNATYGGAIAFVKSGASGGAVGAEGNEAAIRATPFPTIDAAANALPAWNNTNRGHNDHSGAKIYLMDDNGADVIHAIGANITAAAGSCWTEVLPDPANTGVASWRPGGSNRRVTSLFKWRARLETTATTDNLDGNNDNANLMACLDHPPGASKADIVHTALPASVLFYRFGLGYVRNAHLSGANASGRRVFAGTGATRTQQQAFGFTTVKSGVEAAWSFVAWMLVGCDTWRGTFQEADTVGVPNLDSSIGGFIYNNTLFSCQAANEICRRYDTQHYGYALIQNNLERAGVGSTACLLIGGDSRTTAFDNVVEAYTGTPDDGSSIGRSNRAYLDVAGTAGVIKRMTSFGCLWGEFNNKRHPFIANTTERGRVGAAEYSHHVGNGANVSVRGSSGGTAPSPTSWLGEAWPEDSEPYAAGAVGVTYVSNMVGAASAGNGNYRLTGATNDAYDRIPAGMQRLKRDIAGVLRLNDGRGAAGPYERTDVS